jgi:phage terminase small subunit
MAKLTAKQTRFISEYCIDCNAARAAVAAGYSEDTAKEMGYENLTKPHIAKLVREKLLEMASRAEIQPARYCVSWRCWPLRIWASITR